MPPFVKPEPPDFTKPGVTPNPPKPSPPIPSHPVDKPNPGDKPDNALPPILDKPDKPEHKPEHKPVPVPEPKPVPKEKTKEEVEAAKEMAAKNRERDEVLRQITAILLAHNNMESHIPPGDVYWTLLGRYRALGSVP